MYELYISDDNYIQGKKLGRASKSIDSLKQRAREHFEFKIVFINELETESDCVWIETSDSRPVGLIQPKNPGP